MLVYIVWGKAVFGKVNRVPGLFYTGTWFFHLWYIPLIPLGSMRVLHESRNGAGDTQYQGQEIPLSFKSLLLTWARVILIGLAVLGAVMSMVFTIDYSNPIDKPSLAQVIAWYALTIVCIGLLVGSYLAPGIGKARFEQAYQEAEEIGLKPEYMAMLHQYYGRPYAPPLATASRTPSYAPPEDDNAPIPLE